MAGTVPRWVSIAVSLAFVGAACSAPATVLQGKVVESSVRDGRLVVQDETRPESQPVLLDVRTAEMGRAPRKGDRVRVVYRISDNANRVIAVMNLSGVTESGALGPH